MVLVIGMIASVVLVFMSLSSKRNLIVLFSSIVSVLTLAQYALLDRWATAILSVITLMYGLTIPFEKKFPWLRSKISTIILGIVYSAAFSLLTVLKSTLSCSRMWLHCLEQLSWHWKIGG